VGQTLSLKALEWIVPIADDETSALPVLFVLDNGEKQTIILALKHPSDTSSPKAIISRSP
jgi:hypothetical protein